ncbi:uncharacterized protein F5Z01DRAFT_417031 [Emericellopsis atlantica]|uniref:Uncharacterized protein n=1 Tax=Emericellopsis atlantica TaxID=2614577 RepID=A0A9P7ZEQ6_9HYPO|nr:uncharacterized protein F5Z01DRAFT_417031 [Emericellopsis atlantica]KAG9250190.1 hypothetical protein F5Z01DRAFT_417031 [Emericellopsis atlantica]
MDASKSAQYESPEQLLDVFKSAALSVTKLYRSSVAAETRARAEGYQDCLDDLLGLLEKESQFLGESSRSRLHRWITDRRAGREASPAVAESDEDEPDKSAPVPTSTSTAAPLTTPVPPAPSPAPATAPTTASADVASQDMREPEFIVPSQDSFTFQSDHQYPDIELLDLSEDRVHNNASNNHGARTRRNVRSGPRQAGPLGRGAGAKRRLDFNDFFDFGKDGFGGGKRSRHL